MMKHCGQLVGPDSDTFYHKHGFGFFFYKLCNGLLPRCQPKFVMSFYSPIAKRKYILILLFALLNTLIRITEMTGS